MDRNRTAATDHITRIRRILADSEDAVLLAKIRSGRAGQEWDHAGHDKR